MKKAVMDTQLDAFLDILPERANKKEIILHSIRLNGPQTSEEIVKSTEMIDRTVTARISELYSEGKIEPTGIVREGIRSKKNQNVWGLSNNYLNPDWRRPMTYKEKIEAIELLVNRYQDTQGHAAASFTLQEIKTILSR